MLRLASSSALVAILVAIIPSASDAFSSSIHVVIHPKITPARLLVSSSSSSSWVTQHKDHMTSLYYHPKSFDRALDCANTFGLCDIDELLQLSEELEQYQGSFYENDQEARAKEIKDRKDLANMLLLQGELIENNDYAEKGNLFVHDVQAGHDMEDRDDFLEQIAPSMDI